MRSMILALREFTNWRLNREREREFFFNFYSNTPWAKGFFFLSAWFNQSHLSCPSWWGWIYWSYPCLHKQIGTVTKRRWLVNLPWIERLQQILRVPPQSKLFLLRKATGDHKIAINWVLQGSASDRLLSFSDGWNDE